MYIFITILILIAAILMILIVLVQNSKGGGLAAGFSSSNQIMGVRKTTDFLEKATWTLAATILVLSILTAKFTTSRSCPYSLTSNRLPHPQNNRFDSNNTGKREASGFLSFSYVDYYER